MRNNVLKNKLTQERRREATKRSNNKIIPLLIRTFYQRLMDCRANARNDDRVTLLKY